MLADLSSGYHAYFPHRRMQYAHCNLTQIGFPQGKLRPTLGAYWSITWSLETNDILINLI